MYDIKKIVTTKAHESSIEFIEKSNVPRELYEHLTYDFMESISKVLSDITRESFLYTGKIILESQSLRTSFTSSSCPDTIDLIMDFVHNGGYRFINLNNKLEKVLTPEIKEDTNNADVEVVVEKEKDPIPAPVKKKKTVKKAVKKTEPPIDPIKDSIDLMFNAVKKLEVKDDVAKKVSMLEKIISTATIKDDTKTSTIPTPSINKASELLDNLIKLSEPTQKKPSDEFIKTSKQLQSLLDASND